VLGPHRCLRSGSPKPIILLGLQRSAFAVRKLLLTSAVLACVASVFVNAYGQGSATSGTKKAAPAAPATPAAEPPHKIALIDMGRVFKEYKKIEALKEDWKSEFSVNENQAKKLTTQIQNLVEEMKQFKPGSPEFIKLEKQHTQATAEFQSFQKNAQRDLVRKEADLLKTVYLEAMEVVGKFADRFGYTLVMRFNSDTFEGDDVNKFQLVMNRVIVYHRPEDDLTDGVIKYLNSTYDRSLKAASTNNGPAAGTPRIANQNK
jgi:Skp family chaperone for outer membrane proteins